MQLCIPGGRTDLTAHAPTEKGADKMAKTNEGVTSLHKAVKKGHETVVQLLLENVDVKRLYSP